MTTAMDVSASASPSMFTADLVFESSLRRSIPPMDPAMWSVQVTAMPRMLLSAKKVRERREALGMTQLEAARTVGWGISQPWWRLEQRDSDPPCLDRVEYREGVALPARRAAGGAVGSSQTQVETRGYRYNSQSGRVSGLPSLASRHIFTALGSGCSSRWIVRRK